MSQWKPKQTFSSNGIPLCPHCGVNLWSELKDTDFLIGKDEESESTPFNCIGCGSLVLFDAELSVTWRGSVISAPQEEKNGDIPSV